MHRSWVSNSLSSQVNLYILVVTAGNSNAVNEALRIGWVCATPQKYVWPCCWMHSRLYRDFVERFMNSIIWWDGVSGKTPSVPWLLQVGVIIWRGAKDHQVGGFPNNWVGVRWEHHQIISQLSHQNFRVFVECWHNGRLIKWGG